MTTFLVILLGSNMIKHLGWRVGALATPFSMAILAAPFFLVVIASKVRASGLSARPCLWIRQQLRNYVSPLRFCGRDPLLVAPPREPLELVSRRFFHDGHNSRTRRDGRILTGEGLPEAPEHLPPSARCPALCIPRWRESTETASAAEARGAK